MFGRRRSPDKDVVAAAQRRLAALTATAAAPLRSHEAPALDRSPRSLDQWAFGSPPTPFDSTVIPEPAAVPRKGGEIDAKAPMPRHAASRQAWAARFAFSPHQIAVAALVVVAVVVALAWWALRSVPEAHSVTLSSERVLPPKATPGPPSAAADPAPPSPGGGAAAGGPEPSPGTGGVLVIDVAGKVRDPGIVELPAGSRVVDAIAAAGGARPGVSLTALNLARLLVDGEQIVVGVDVPVSDGGGAAFGGQVGAGAASITPVNLNTATAEQLDTLPDVGPVTAQAILQWRTDNGAFARVDDLLKVSGIGPATLADVRPYVYV
jgi:competence protein ComEA